MQFLQLRIFEIFMWKVSVSGGKKKKKKKERKQKKKDLKK